uniref:Splicing factor YJU2 n=1 Tax=Otolemur garnettii TaxID=30611 RepID=H0XMB5_OTOGA
MSERKVLNKYYPLDLDSSKIPKLKLPKDQQYVVRLMAPFNMRCKTCGEYIYKGKKFSAQKETVQNEVYLGLPIFRFYIKCTCCLAEIRFKMDPQNTDYTMEHGATWNFQAEKLLEEEKRVQKEREDEELNNPMKVLENRTKDSKLEMEVLENLQELKDLIQRQAHVDFEAMLRQHRLSEEERQKQEQEEDEQETAALLEEARKRRLLEDSDSEDAAAPPPPRPALWPSPTAILDKAPEAKGRVESWEQGISSLGRPQLSGLEVVKKTKAGADQNTGQGQVIPGTLQSRKVADPTPLPPATSSLSQLGVYLGSDDSSGSN